MTDNNAVARVPARELSLPTKSWHSFEDVRLHMDTNPDVAELVKKTAESNTTVNVGETMKNLMIASSTIQLAVAASHGYECNPIIIKMLSRFQTLVKDCTLTINAFLNTSVEAVSLHQDALELLTSGQAQDAMALLGAIVEMADAMAAKADKLANESSELVTLGEDALVSASTDRTKTTEERREAEKSIADLSAKKQALEERKSKLQQSVIEAKEQEQKAVEEASTERQHKFITDIVSIIGNTTTNVANSVPNSVTNVANGILGGNRNVPTSATSVPQDFAPAIAAKKVELLNVEAELSGAQDDDKTTEIKKRISDLKNELEALQTKQSTASSLNSAQQREVMLIQARIGLQKLELDACAELAESVAKLENMHLAKNELEQAVRSLDVAVKALGRVKTTFENTRAFWKGNRESSELMGREAQRLNLFKNAPDVLRQRITHGGYKWMALGQTNYTAMKAIEEANTSVDKVMNNLPSTEDARKMVEQLIPQVIADLESERDQLSREIEAATASA